MTARAAWPSGSPTRERIERLLRPLSTERPPLGRAGAAVVVLLREGPHSVETLLVEKSTRPSDPASGQVGLPGGHVTASDPDLRATVLREFEEEVGLTERDIEGPVHFVAIEPARAFGVDVAVFAGALAKGAAEVANRSPEEIAHIFWFPEAALGRITRVRVPTIRGEMDVDAAVVDGHTVWGFTLRVLRTFFGRPPA